MAVLAPIGPAPLARSFAPFFEGDVVRYSGTTFRNFIVARCYSRTLNGDTRWIVEERNADTHDPLELELLHRDNLSSGHCRGVP